MICKACPLFPEQVMPSCSNIVTSCEFSQPGTVMPLLCVIFTISLCFQLLLLALSYSQPWCSGIAGCSADTLTVPLTAPPIASLLNNPTPPVYPLHGSVFIPTCGLLLPVSHDSSLKPKPHSNLMSKNDLPLLKEGALLFSTELLLEIWLYSWESQRLSDNILFHQLK